MKAMSYAERIEDLLEDMSVFDDWTEKYEFIISLGRKLPAMPEVYRKPGNLIKGCQSRVWVGTELQNGKMNIFADSDSLITKGLIALFIRLLSGLTPEEIQKCGFASIGRMRIEGAFGLHASQCAFHHGCNDSERS